MNISVLVIGYIDLSIDVLFEQRKNSKVGLLFNNFTKYN